MWMRHHKLPYPGRLMGYLLALSFHRGFYFMVELRMKLSQDENVLYISEILYCTLEKMILYLLWVNANSVS